MAPTGESPTRAFGHLITGGDNPDVIRGVGPDKALSPPPPEDTRARATGLDWAAISPPRTGPDPFAAATAHRDRKAAVDQAGRFTTPTATPETEPLMPDTEPTLDGWMALHREGMDSDRASVRRAATKLMDAVTTLRSLLADDREARAARAAAAAAERAKAEKIAALRAELEELTGKPVKVRATGAAAGGGRRDTDDYPASTREIRQWAKENGVECPAAGRFLPASVVDAYRAANAEAVAS